nr:MAG TPA: hypothetical protein [Bacteriophage sp.]
MCIIFKELVQTLHVLIICNYLSKPGKPVLLSTSS